MSQEGISPHEFLTVGSVALQYRFTVALCSGGCSRTFELGTEAGSRHWALSLGSWHDAHGGLSP